jgi:hypothetical protein
LFQLLTPISLLALSGIALPLILHLRKVRRGKTLAIGSIAFFDKSAPSRGRSLRLSDLLLLFLRLLLVAVLALLLAGPIWKTAPSPRATGWLVLEKHSLGEAYARSRALVDSLLEAGYVLHDFSPGFPVMTLRDSTDTTAKRTAPVSYGDPVSNGVPVSYWLLAGALQEQSPAGIPLCLLTTGRLNRFRGPRPVIGPRLHWYTYVSGDSSSTWISGAYRMVSDSVRIGRFLSRPSGNTLVWQTVSSQTGVWAPGARDAGQPVPFSLDTGLSVTLYSDRYITDLRYIKAALEAIRNYTGRRIRVTAVPAGGQLPDTQDWLFWLSARSVPGDKKAAHIFRYEPGQEMQDGSPISFGEAQMLAAEPIFLHRIFHAAADTGAATDVSGFSAETPVPIAGSPGKEPLVLWTDAWGRPLLTEQTLSGQTTDHFYSRLDPAWNGLVWSPAFPLLLMKLLYGRTGGYAGTCGSTYAGDGPGDSAAKNDLRVIDDRQLLSDGSAGGSGGNAVAPNEDAGASRSPVTDLSHVFWLTAFILFVMERLLALYGTRKERAYAGK